METLSTLLDNCQFGYAYHKIILDQNGIPIDYIFLSANKNFETFTNLKIDNIIGKSVKEIIPNIVKSDFDWIKYYGEVALKGENRTFEQYSEHFDKYFQINCYSDKKYYFTTIFIDVTKYKKLEMEINKKLKKEQDLLKKYDKIFNSTPAMISLNNVNDKKYVEVNNAFLETLDFKRDEVIGKDLDEVDVATNPERFKNIQNHLKNFGSIRNLDVKLKTKSGKIVEGIFFGDVIEDEDKKYYLSVIVDITNQRKAEREARKADEIKSQFLANMSHEIRTPLNGIIGFSEILKNTPLSDNQKEYIDIIVRSGNTLLDVIENILEYSIIKSENFNIKKDKVDIKMIFYHIIDSLNHKILDKKIKINKNFNKNIPKSIYLDQVRLTQALYKILDNAIKFTDSSGDIELKIDFTFLSNSKGKLFISIIDSGIGISEIEIDKIFLPFVQIENSDSRRFGGTGLGLSIAEKLIEKMGGILKVKSEIDIGSEFYFTLIVDF